MLREAPAIDEPIENLDPEAAIADLLATFQTIGTGIDAPVRMFSLLCDALRIEKGALLLPDFDGVHFAPWALRGLDNTSERRMQIPTAMLRGLCDTKVVEIVEAGRLQPWLQFLSFRQASMVKRLALLPFCVDNTIVAMIVIVASPYLSLESIAIRLIVAAVRQQMLSLILHNQEVRIRARFRKVLGDRSEIVQQIGTELARSEGKVVILAVIDIDPLLNAICGSSPDTDRFRLQQDILRIIGSMLEDTATAGALSSGRIVIILQPGQPAGAELVVHQLEVGLRDLFHELSQPVSLNPHYRTVTRDVASINDLLDEV